MKAIVTALVFAIGLGVGVSAASADPIKERKKVMKTVLKSIKTVGKMAKGKEPYNEATAREALKIVAKSTNDFVKFFPEGAKEDDFSEERYYAKDAVWEQWDDFKKKAVELNAAAEKASASKDLDSLKVSVKDVFASCKSCHEKYRGKR